MSVAFASVGEYATAWDQGRSHFCSIRKVPSQASLAGVWADLSMAAGNPKPNYYASDPLTAAVLDGYDGIWHGPPQAPAQKHLAHWGLMSPTAGFVGQFKMLDYLLYYPFIDADDTDAQAMDNTVSLPRYEDGEGVQVMAVAVAPSTGSGAFTFDYINQDGDARTSPTQGCNGTASNITNLITCQAGGANTTGTFLKLAAGDTGVRSITSVTFLIANGGLIALVLVQPLADLAIREINTMAEVEFLTLRSAPPRILDGAYLNMIVNTPATIAAGILTGYADFVWSDD